MTSRSGIFAALALGIAVAVAASCHPPVPAHVDPPKPLAPVVDDELPLGRLPSDVKPLRYRLDLAIVPADERFHGTIEIDVELTKPRAAIWLHGLGLTVSSTTVTPRGKPAIAASYQQKHDGGVAKLTLPAPLPPGRATLKLVFDAAYDKHQAGLYRSVRGDASYAFTQFEPVSARTAFPCFDEPAFKTPWEVSLTVPDGQVAIANTHEIAREPAEKGMTRVRFAPTEALPSYLVAFAVGPLDVVEAPPIPASSVRPAPLPFRAVAAKGRGKELAYAVAHTPAIVAALEDYFGIAYPYDKLDILAVPDRTGAMENAGAITFREWLLLLDDSSPFEQKKSFAYVMAHELAHQWFGDLVTMPWWDDIWLNEAFATWMGFRAIHALEPSYMTEITELQGVLDTMGVDSLMSARQIRQPVAVNEEIHAAFDAITYRKGGAVLSMFERWVGPEKFREGIHKYLEAHRHGLATADDLLAALDGSTGKSVGAPFRTFLDQPGLPYLAVTPSCEGERAAVTIAQSRYLPLGSKGDPNKSWRIPVCLRYQSGAVHEQCFLLEEASARVDLEAPGCPEWILPNADSAGYFAWSLPSEWLAKLTGRGLASLPVRERMGLGRAIRAAYSAGAVDGKAALEASLALVSDPHAEVSGVAMMYFQDAFRWLDGDPLLPSVAKRVRAVYRPIYDRAGSEPKKGEAMEQKLLRRAALSYLALLGDDAAVKKRSTELTRSYLGSGGDGKIHKDAMEADVVGVILQIAGESADPALYDALVTHIATAEDEELRGNLLRGASSPRNSELAAKARGLALDPLLRQSELLVPLMSQMAHPITRPATWAWVKLHIDELVERMPPRLAGYFPMIGAELCDVAAVDEVRQLFEPRLPRLLGGQRTLANAIEAIELCAARKQAQLPSLRKYLEGAK